MEISAAAATAAAAAMPMHVVEGHTTKKTMELKWVSRRSRGRKIQMEKTMKTPLESKPKAPATLQALVPVFISTNPSHVNPDDLSDLFIACNLSCHRFPNYVDAGGGRCVVEAVDLHKLRVALSHSSVLVSVFCKPNDVIAAAAAAEEEDSGFWRVVAECGDACYPLNSQLVGFGRAVSDLGLTASIYDVMVLPSLRGMGIGRMICRMLTSRDIYDIAALCSENERLYCNDVYESSVSTNPQDNQIVKPAGRKLLFLPICDALIAEEKKFDKRGYPIMLLGYKNYLTTKKVLSISLFLQLAWYGKLWVEVCLISARGLRRSSSLWKLQWYAVGWTNPNNKYCTKIDASGNANPVWKTKFATLVEDSESNLKDLALHIEVYSREPIFLRERLQGTATIVLREFLAKHNKNSEASRQGAEEVGSYQLRKKKSNKPQGFVDVSIRISEDMEARSSYTGSEGGPTDLSNTITLAIGDGSSPTFQPLAPHQRPESQLRINSPYAQPRPFPTNYSNPYAVGPSHPPSGGPSYPPASGPSYPPASGPSYEPPKTPPPPPPPSNVGYIPTFIPRTDRMSDSYVNMPSSGAPPGRRGAPGFGMGMGAGALAAGAVIFGDDFMSGFDMPSGLQDASLTISTDPPF
ncbi:hypothetical protein GBA52_006477 [Prunus armeniaca]|nr:hypothetical protein GBA52_006477 [Prunus armeniaca]